LFLNILILGIVLPILMYRYSYSFAFESPRKWRLSTETCSSYLKFNVRFMCVAGDCDWL